VDTLQFPEFKIIVMNLVVLFHEHQLEI